jgi:hypothetical protein
MGVRSVGWVAVVLGMGLGIGACGQRGGGGGGGGGADAGPGVDAGRVDTGAGGEDSGPAGTTGTVNGTIAIVNAPGGASASVILVPAAEWVRDGARETVPEGPRVAGITGAFTITDVPPGTYVVVVAFENESLVLDPDPSFAGIQEPVVTIPPAGGTVTIADTIRVTGAFELLAPGRDATQPHAGSFLKVAWEDDSAEDSYLIRIFDEGGSVAAEMMAPGSAGGTVTQGVDSGGLSSGLYVVRVYSMRSPGGTPIPISATENLRGLMRVGP